MLHVILKINTSNNSIALLSRAPCLNLCGFIRTMNIAPASVSSPQLTLFLFSEV